MKYIARISAHLPAGWNQADVHAELVLALPERMQVTHHAARARRRHDAADLTVKFEAGTDEEAIELTDAVNANLFHAVRGDFRTLTAAPGRRIPLS